MASENISLGTVKNGGSTQVQSTYFRGDDDNFPRDGSQVEAKYMGTIADQHDMTVLGRTQVLRVRIPQVLIDHPLE
jgi:hypothetical protein